MKIKQKNNECFIRIHNHFIFTKKYILNKGLVIKSTGRWYIVKGLENGRLINCTVKGKLRLKGLRSTNPVATGDTVYFRYVSEKSKQEGVIEDVEPRKNYIIRRSSNLSKQYHLIAANIDLAVLMITLKNPKTPMEFVDRFLVSAEAYNITSAILINKTDIYGDVEKNIQHSIESTYTRIGYQCFGLSLVTGDHFDEVKHLLKNKISVIAGNSGVGKSSLLNKIHPDLNLKTKEISGLHKTGKHTTTFAEMHELPTGGYVIDTPGIRAFGLIDIDKEELYHFFPEIFEASYECKYNNCLHVNEPGCNVKKQIEFGQISEQRYKSYLNMLLEDQSKYRTS